MILAILHLNLWRISPEHIYILCKPQFCQFFFPFFVVIYYQNKTCISFILVFSYPVFFCLFLCLFSTFPVSLLSPLSFFLYPVLYLSHCLFLCLSSTIFLASLLLSFFTCLLIYIFFFLFCFPFVCVFFGVFFLSFYSEFSSLQVIAYCFLFFFFNFFISVFFFLFCLFHLLSIIIFSCSNPEFELLFFLFFL